MGQRSQIFVRFEKNPGEKEIVARYYKWNCGDQMISIVYHTIEWLKKHLDLNNCGSGQYLLWNQKEFIRILGTKYDLGDVVIITDILNKYGDYWKDDNDGKALIDIQCFMLDGERDTEFGIKEADYGNRVLCTSREDAEKYIEKTKLILEIHSRGLREKDFSLSQLHELQNYLERTEK